MIKFLTFPSLQLTRVRWWMRMEILRELGKTYHTSRYKPTFWKYNRALESFYFFFFLHTSKTNPKAVSFYFSAHSGKERYKTLAWVWSSLHSHSLPFISTFFLHRPTVLDVINERHERIKRERQLVLTLAELSLLLNARTYPAAQTKLSSWANVIGRARPRWL